jgi:hypothetical protein
MLESEGIITYESNVVFVLRFMVDLKAPRPARPEPNDPSSAAVAQ